MCVTSSASHFWISVHVKIHQEGVCWSVFNVPAPCVWVLLEARGNLGNSSGLQQGDLTQLNITVDGPEVTWGPSTVLTAGFCLVHALGWGWDKGDGGNDKGLCVVGKYNAAQGKWNCCSELLAVPQGSVELPRSEITHPKTIMWLELRASRVQNFLPGKRF